MSAGLTKVKSVLYISTSDKESDFVLISLSFFSFSVLVWTQRDLRYEGNLDRESYHDGSLSHIHAQ